MEQAIQQLKNQLDTLQKQVDSFYSSSTIDRNVETAFTERLPVPLISGTGSASTQSVSVPSVPTNITVPAQPTGTLAVVFKGVTYNLLYK